MCECLFVCVHACGRVREYLTYKTDVCMRASQKIIARFTIVILFYFNSIFIIWVDQCHIVGIEVKGIFFRLFSLWISKQHFLHTFAKVSICWLSSSSFISYWLRTQCLYIDYRISWENDEQKENKSFVCWGTCYLNVSLSLSISLFSLLNNFFRIISFNVSNIKYLFKWKGQIHK